MRNRLPRRLVTLAGLALLALVISAAPATGIVYGEPDGGDHPMVGSIVYRVDTGEGDVYFQVCSGTLVEGLAADRPVLLTAAHCVYDVFIPGAEVLVTFDETIDPGGTYYTGERIADPRFGTQGMADAYDVGLIVLDEDPGVGYADVASQGTLDALKQSGDLKDQRFTTVGYGAVRESRTTSFAAIDSSNLSRNRADQGFLSLTKAWITMGMNEAYGGAGTCYGDSGGPHFIEGTTEIVSVTSTGDTPCKATDKTYRVDTSQAYEFLGQFVQLP